MTYIDGFVVPVPEGNIETYQALAQKAGALRTNIADFLTERDHSAT